MKKLIKKYLNYFEPKSIKMINDCFILSIITCLIGLLFISYYNTYYISIFLYRAGIIIFRTGLMIGLFPPFFTIIIQNWKTTKRTLIHYIKVSICQNSVIF